MVEENVAAAVVPCGSKGRYSRRRERLIGAVLQACFDEEEVKASASETETEAADEKEERVPMLV